MKIFIGIIVAAVILIGGFFAFNNYIYQEKQGADTEVGKQEYEPEPSAPQTTYQHSLLGFEFSVPKNTEIKQDDRGDRSYFIGIGDPRTYYARMYINFFVDGVAGPGDETPTVSTSTMIIAGIDATQTIRRLPSSGITHRIVSFTKGEDSYSLDFPYTTAEDITVSDGIIKSFHFQL